MLPFRNQIEEWQTKVGVIVRNLHNQSQVGPDHERARLAIALLDLGSELDLLLRSQERDLPDLAQIDLYTTIAIFSGHITSLHECWGDWGLGSTKFAAVLCADTSQITPINIYQVFNKIKYSRFRQILDVACSMFLRLEFQAPQRSVMLIPHCRDRPALGAAERLPFGEQENLNPRRDATVDSVPGIATLARVEPM